MTENRNDGKPSLPPGGTWADPGLAMAVALSEIEKCAETLRRLAPLDGGEPVGEGGTPSAP